MKNYVILLLSLLTSAIIGCVDAIDAVLPSSHSKLVVSGIITNQEGPYRVELSRSVEFLATDKAPYKVTGAKIFVADDLGNEIEFLEEEEGIYTSVGSDFTGEIGRSYTLHITTADNKTYVSKAEKILPVPDVKITKKEFVRDEYLNELDNKVDRPLFDIYVETTNTDVSPAYIRWGWKGVYEIETFPMYSTEILVYYLNPLEPDTIPRPPVCSGFIYDLDSQAIVPDTSCTCCVCWITDYQDRFLPAHKPLTTGQSIRGQIAAKVPLNTQKFQRRYMVEMQQHSLTPEAYQYWDLIERQQNNTGSIFEAAPAKITGNISNVNDPSEEVLGYFVASAVTTDIIFLERGDVPYPIAEADSIIMPCTNLANSTNIKPEFW